MEKRTFNLNDFNGLEFFIAWKKSSCYGLCPSIYLYSPITQKRVKYYAGGCGYDKRSTVVAKALNDNPYILLLLKEYRAKVEAKEIEKDYGIDFDENGGASLAYGVGVDCYRSIFKAVGFEFTCYSADYCDSDFVIIRRITE